MPRPYSRLGSFELDISRHSLRYLFNLIGIIVAFSCVSAQAGSVEDAPVGGLGEDDRLEIQMIIGAQLDAFQTEDAELAFSYASPSIREKFRTPGRFFAMVRNHYPAVYDGRNPEFLQLKEIAGVFIQPVIISDRLGEAWLAQYPMEQQPDGQWLINGCLVNPLEDRHL